MKSEPAKLSSHVDDIREKLGYIEADLAKARWQPIETAPKGHRVLLHSREWPMPRVGRKGTANAHPATHWMPIPELPES